MPTTSHERLQSIASEAKALFDSVDTEGYRAAFYKVRADEPLTPEESACLQAAQDATVKIANLEYAIEREYKKAKTSAERNEASDLFCSFSDQWCTLMKKLCIFKGGTP